MIVYNWDKTVQPNDGYSDHIGFVEKISGGMITAIEGVISVNIDYRSCQEFLSRHWEGSWRRKTCRR